MTRSEYMAALARLLAALPEAERQDALRYYEEYFDAAGPEKEAEVMAGLGSPAQLAQKLMEGQPLVPGEVPQAEAYTEVCSAGPQRAGRGRWLALVGLAAAAALALGVGAAASLRTSGPSPASTSPSTAVYTSSGADESGENVFRQELSLHEARRMKIKLAYGAVDFVVEENAEAAVLEFTNFRPDWLTCQTERDDGEEEYVIRYELPKDTGLSGLPTARLTITLPAAALQELDIALGLGDLELGSLAVPELDIVLAMGSLYADELLAEEVSVELPVGSAELGVLRADDEAEFTLGMGDLDIQEASARELGIVLAMGDLDIQEASVRELGIDLGTGDLTVARLDGLDKASIDLGVGSGVLGVTGAEGDYAINARCGLGSIHIDGRSVGARYKAGSGAKLELDCGMGSLELAFGK